MRLRFRLALAAAGLAAGNGAVLARGGALGRRIAAVECGVAAGLVATRLATQGLTYPVWPSDAQWPAYPIVGHALFGLDARRPGAGRRFARGIPQRHYGAAGWHANPALVGWWAVAQLSAALNETSEDPAWDRFWTAVDWLRAHARYTPSGCAVWPYMFPWREGRALLRPPWVSAMAQGLAISALVRAWDLRRDPADLELARRALGPFGLPPDDGGVRVEEASDVFFEEYPATPYPRILDGFAFAVLGLHDLAVHGGDDEAAAHFRAGLSTLSRRIDDWDFARCWTWYGRHGLLSTAQYNTLNACLAQVVGRLGADERLRAAGERWWPEDLTLAQRSLIRTVSPVLWSRFVVQQSLGLG